jgi:hypothetical protein
MLAVYHGPHIMIGGGQIMEVKNEDDKVMIHIDNDGKVTYGDNYKPDETAKVFWTTLAQSYPGVCEKIEAEKKQ